MITNLANVPESEGMDLQRSGVCALHRRERRRWGWLLLVALLFVQAKAAIGGCLLDATYAPAAPTLAAPAQGDAATDPCCPEGQTSRCADDCNPSASVPKAATDQAAIVPQFAADLRSVGIEPRAARLQVPLATVPRSRDGPPAYLRYLRLLN